MRVQGLGFIPLALFFTISDIRGGNRCPTAYPVTPRGRGSRPDRPQMAYKGLSLDMDTLQAQRHRSADRGPQGTHRGIEHGQLTSPTTYVFISV